MEKRLVFFELLFLTFILASSSVVNDSLEIDSHLVTGVSSELVPPTSETYRWRQKEGKDNPIDSSVDIVGKFCIGHNLGCCLSMYFFYDTDIQVHVYIESKREFSQLRGTYNHNNRTGKWECKVEGMPYWDVTVKETESSAWSGNFDLQGIVMGKSGASKQEIWFTTQSYGEFLYPKRLKVNQNESGDFVTVKTINITKPNSQARVNVTFTVLDFVMPDIWVTPTRETIREQEEDLYLSCKPDRPLPRDTTLLWEKDGKFLGSLFMGYTKITHKGVNGKVSWDDEGFVYHKIRPNLEESGIYRCCITVRTYHKICKTSSVSVFAPRRTVCEGRSFQIANPFQINHFQSIPLLTDGNFVKMLWNFNLSEWKISTQYPKCKEHLVNMELGLEQWFDPKAGIPSRSARGVIEGILGGLGSIASLTNSLDISTLQSDLESAGLLSSRGIKTQRSINQILQNMVVKTANVVGPSIIHLQEATIALMDSDQHYRVARACLEIQSEFSMNVKLIAQAFQDGSTPLGIVNSLPSEYKFALDHLDLWVNKWVGCKGSICHATSLIPVAGQQQVLAPISVLGIPVSESQLLFYQLQFTDFTVGNDSIPVQLDLSSCLKFPSKVLCLRNQVKEIYHSCFHNHSLCNARVETIRDPHELFTPIGPMKNCLQVLMDGENVQAFFDSCVHSEKLSRGLYCINGNLEIIRYADVEVNVSSVITRTETIKPPDYNISIINEFPWQEWTEELRKDRGLLEALRTEIKRSEIIFNHEQGNLERIEHEWQEFSGSTWWGRFKKSINSWSKTSVGKMAENILLHPFVILFIIAVACIIFQLGLACRIRSYYIKIRKELQVSERRLRDTLMRRIALAGSLKYDGENSVRRSDAIS